MDSGLDSLGAVELRNAIAAAFNTPIPATITFDHPTIRLIAEQVAPKGTQMRAPAEGAACGLADFDEGHVLACVLEAAAEILQAPVGPDQPLMVVSPSLALVLLLSVLQ